MLRYFSLILLASGAAGAATGPTYYKDVVPVLQRNCQSCHRPGEAAPMSFLDYQSTRPWAKAIKSAVQVKKMPPWSADQNASHKFANDRSLSEADRNTLLAWVEAGAPEGNPKEAPKPPSQSMRPAVNRSADKLAASGTPRTRRRGTYRRRA